MRNWQLFVKRREQGGHWSDEVYWGSTAYGGVPTGVTISSSLCRATPQTVLPREGSALCLLYWRHCLSSPFMPEWGPVLGSNFAYGYLVLLCLLLSASNFPPIPQREKWFRAQPSPRGPHGGRCTRTGDEQLESWDLRLGRWPRSEHRAEGWARGLLWRGIRPACHNPCHVEHLCNILIDHE